MNSETERYLKRATRGLWGRRRHEVQEELAAHLEARVTAHRIAGLSERDATDKALAELGSPQLVNTGMARLYTLPTVMGSGLAVMALCLSVLAFWPQGVAQPAVSASFYWPTQACVKAQQMDALYGACEEFDTLWLEPESFKAELRRQNVKVDEGTNLTLTFPNGAYASLSTQPSEMMMDDRSIVTQQGFIAFNELFAELQNQPGTLWFEGWNNPVVHIGKVTFQLGTEKHRVSGDKVYGDMLQSIFFDLFTNSPSVPKASTTYYMVDPRRELQSTIPEIRLEVSRPGVYGVMTSVNRELFQAAWMPPAQPGDVLTAFQVVRPDDAGMLVAKLPAGVKFATRLGSGVGTNTAVLVRFADSPTTGAMGYSVVAPGDITPIPIANP